MQSTAILVTSNSVTAHVSQAVESIGIFKEVDPLYGFLAQNPNTIVILHYNSLCDTLLDIIASLGRDFPASGIAVISDNPSFEEGFELLSYGIKAYANSYMGDLHYAQLLTMVKENKVWLYPEFMQQLISHTIAPQTNSANVSVMECLTPREHEIASLVCDNLSNQEIAEQTGITVRTVKQHLTNIYEKLDIKDRLSLALLMK